MKRFVFRLQTLLNHRRSIEQMLLGELAHLRIAEQSEQAKLVECRSAQQRSWQAFSILIEEGASPWDLAGADEHCKALGDDLRLQELNLAAVQREVESKLAEVIEAAKQRKVLEQLCDRQRREYELEAARMEQKELDEMASVRFARGIA